MNWDFFSASILYVEDIYFLMACVEEPPLSLSALMAALTIWATGGCDGVVLVFFEAPAAAFPFFALGVPLAA